MQELGAVLNMANKQQLKIMKRFHILAFASLYPFVLYRIVTLASSIISQTSIFRVLSSNADIVLPLNLDQSLLDISQYEELKNTDTSISATPFYWHIPKAGGTTVHDDYVQCFALVEASELGSINQGNTLELVEINGGNYHVNVDTSILPGILHAAELGLVPSKMAEIIFSPLLHESSTHLFTPDYQGQMFAMFRHPVDRVVSLFHYLRSATWEPTYNPILQNMTLQEYADSELAESNFVVRALVDKMEGTLTLNDVELAKEILRRKCVVGLLDKWEESMDRFDNYFGFQPHGDRHEEARRCRMQLRESGGSNKHPHPHVNHTSEEYATLERINTFDLILYDYIHELFLEQGMLANRLVAEGQFSDVR